MMESMADIGLYKSCINVFAIFQDRNFNVTLATFCYNCVKFLSFLKVY